MFECRLDVAGISIIAYSIELKLVLNTSYRVVLTRTRRTSQALKGVFLEMPPTLACCASVTRLWTLMMYGLICDPVS